MTLSGKHPIGQMTVMLSQTTQQMFALDRAVKLSIGDVEGLKLQINSLIVARKPPYWVRDWRHKRNH